MKLQLIHIDNYLVVVDDSEIKERDWFVMNGCIIRQCKSTNKEQHTIPTVVDTIGGIHHVSVCEKITHHLPLNNALVSKRIELLPPLEDEVERLAISLYPKEEFWIGDCKGRLYDQNANQRIHFAKGYNKAKEDERNKLTPFKNLIALMENGLLKGTIDIHDLLTDEIKVCKEYLQSLSQPNLPTSFDTETKKYIY